MQFKIIGIGEVLWDLLPSGKQLGGAPANFAYHARSLGADARIISRVGNDENGRQIISRLQQLGLSTDCVETDPVVPTGTVSVELTSDGQPHYIIHQNVAWDHLIGEGNAERAITQADATCFGTLAQRSETSRTNILRLLQIAPQNSLRILDVNLRQQYFSREIIENSLRHANALKVNDAELPLIAEMFNLSGEPRSLMTALADKFRLRLVACTRGGHGSLLLSQNTWSEHPGFPAKVADTIGAGDSFTAAITLGFLSGHDLDTINMHANRLASFVASQPGATPVLPPNLSSS
jgi:fructokinase